jgi:hypothetical protein
MPQPWSITVLLSRGAVCTRTGLSCLACGSQQFSPQMKICPWFRNRRENFDTRKSGAPGFARSASPMSGALPVTMMRKVNSHERLPRCRCREFDVLYRWRVARRCANQSITDSKDYNPRSRYVDASGPSPACSSDQQGCACRMRRDRSALRSDYPSKPAVMSRRDYLGGRCGCQRGSGYKNGHTLSSSPGKRATISQHISSPLSTTPIPSQ